MLAANHQKSQPEGPQNVITDLRTTFGEVIVFLFTIGMSPHIIKFYLEYEKLIFN